MFALIETKGATHIAINIPKEGADKSLPALAAMLEHNAVFFNKSWREISMIQPSMSIILGNSYRAEDVESAEIVVLGEPIALDESFVIASPDVFVSNKKALTKKDEEIRRLNAELAHVREQLKAAQERLEVAE